MIFRALLWCSDFILVLLAFLVYFFLCLFIFVVVAKSVLFFVTQGFRDFWGRFVFCFYVVLQNCLEFFLFLLFKKKKKNTYNVQSVFCVFCRPNAHSGSA